MINMGDSEVCMIQLKLKVLGGMRNGRLNQHEKNTSEWRRKDRNIYELREKTATDNWDLARENLEKNDMISR